MASNAKQNPPSSVAKVQAYRDRMRERGYRLVQMWVPDVQSPTFREEAHRQSTIVSRSSHAVADQDFIDAISE